MLYFNYTIMVFLIFDPNNFSANSIFITHCYDDGVINDQVVSLKYSTDFFL